MADLDPPLTPAPGETAPDPPDDAEADDGSLLDDVRDLFDDGRTLIEAELAYQSARGAYAWERAPGIVVPLLVSLAAVFFAMMAVVVGLLLALAPLLTVWGALGAVTALLLVAGFAAYRIAMRRFSAARAKLISGPQLPPAPERVVK